MINELLAERMLPELLKRKNGFFAGKESWEERRQEIIEILSENVYGVMPKYTGKTTWRETEQLAHLTGTLTASRVEISFPTPDGETFTFPVTVTKPDSAVADTPKAAFVYISFGRSWYYPIEELAEQDVIVAEMVMNDVALDWEDHYENLMAAHYYKDGKREPNGFGKIGMWAFAASRVLDYLLAQDYVDPAHVGVIGHSRLGKTALWAGANDTRFTHVFSNDSGCLGAAITRKKVGETYPDIYKNFPYWFCENIRNLAGSVEKSEESDFDQHFLLAASAPRKVYVASASEDEWADPASEYLACVAASSAWEINGVDGFIHSDKMPENGDRFAEGNVGYHLRPGSHFLSRQDWVRHVDFLKRQNRDYE